MAIRKTFPLGDYDPYTRSVRILASTTNPVNGEALESWDLARWIKNPTILWNHDPSGMPVGTGSEVETQPGKGLSALVTVATERVNPFAEQLHHALIAKVIKTVSVGFEPGAATKNADGTVSRNANVLLEISFTPLPADEDAGTAALEENLGAANGDEPPPSSEGEADAKTPELYAEARRKAASEAARTLAKHRHAARAVKLDANANFAMRLDRGSVGPIQRTQMGGARIPARLCRVGVLEYRNPDGSVRRELRLPEEVFHADSIATLQGAPVIDIGDHTGMVTPETYRSVTLGHTESVHTEAGKYVSGELVINDGATLERIDRRERTETSCGYVCRTEETPGVWNGQPFDVIQRGIRYNHVAVCPPNRGRSGPDVGLRLDTNGSDAPPWCALEIDMLKIRLDGKEYEAGSKDHLDKIDEMFAAKDAEIARLGKEKSEADAKVAAATKERDEAQARCDATVEKAAKAEKMSAEEKAKREADDEEREKKTTARIRSRVRLVRSVLRLFGKEEDDEKDEKGEPKMDSLSDRELMLLALKQDNPDFSEKERSDDYIRARFDALIERAPNENGVDSVLLAAKKAKEEAARLDANGTGDVAAVTAARAKRDEETRNAWKNVGNGGKGA